MICHCDPNLHPNQTRLVRAKVGLSVQDIECLPSILLTGQEIEAAHLRAHPGYIEDGDIDWVEHNWYLHHYNAVAYRVSHFENRCAYYRFYFSNDFDAAEARLLT